jgi:sulfur-carrier protein
MFDSLPIQNPKSKIQNRMTVKVLIPTALQKFTSDRATIDCDGNSIAELLDALEVSCPGIKARLCDEAGQLRRFLNLYVNDEDIRFLDNTGTPLKDGDRVSIVPAVAGG